MLSQFSNPALSVFPLTPPLSFSACQPRPPHQPADHAHFIILLATPTSSAFWPRPPNQPADHAHLILLLATPTSSACWPRPPHGSTPLTCAHRCLSSTTICPAYLHQLHTGTSVVLPDLPVPTSQCVGPGHHLSLLVALGLFLTGSVSFSSSSDVDLVLWSVLCPLLPRAAL